MWNGNISCQLSPSMQKNHINSWPFKWLFNGAAREVIGMRSKAHGLSVYSLSLAEDGSVISYLPHSCRGAYQLTSWLRAAPAHSKVLAHCTAPSFPLAYGDFEFENSPHQSQLSNASPQSIGMFLSPPAATLLLAKFSRD